MSNETIDISKEVESLAKKAETAEKSEDALRFSQAACNAANAMSAVNRLHNDLNK